MFLMFQAGKYHRSTSDDCTVAESFSLWPGVFGVDVFFLHASTSQSATIFEKVMGEVSGWTRPFGRAAELVDEGGMMHLLMRIVEKLASPALGAGSLIFFRRPFPRWRFLDRTQASTFPQS